MSTGAGATGAAPGAGAASTAGLSLLAPRSPTNVNATAAMLATAATARAMIGQRRFDPAAPIFGNDVAATVSELTIRSTSVEVARLRLSSPDITIDGNGVTPDAASHGCGVCRLTTDCSSASRSSTAFW